MFGSNKWDDLLGGSSTYNFPSGNVGAFGGGSNNNWLNNDSVSTAHYLSPAQKSIYDNSWDVLLGGSSTYSFPSADLSTFSVSSSNLSTASHHHVANNTWDNLLEGSNIYTTGASRTCNIGGGQLTVPIKAEVYDGNNKIITGKIGVDNANHLQSVLSSLNCQSITTNGRLDINLDPVSGKYHFNSPDDITLTFLDGSVTQYQACLVVVI